MAKNEIIGKRIKLRDIKTSDLDAFKKWQIGDQEWKLLDGPYYKKNSGEEIDEYIEILKQNIAKKEWPNPRKRLIIADLDSDRLLGTVNWYWQSVETHWISSGIVIYDPSIWKTGIGYEAFGIWSQYLLDAMPQIARLDLRTWSGNHGMMALARKLGFTLEAQFRKARIVDGKYYDSIGYGILREEWNALYPKGFIEHLEIINK